MTRTASDPAIQAIYEAGHRIVGRYLVRERIGGGPLGVVFRAEDAVNGGRTVAVKVVWPELTPDDGARGRFVAAATVARNVSSKYVGGVSDVFVDVVRGTPVCLVVGAILQRPTLASRLEERLRNSEPMLAVEAQPIVSQIGVGLSAIHAAGLVHGNLKARNIFFPDEQVQIADVGIAGGLSPALVAQAEASLGRDTGRAPEAAAGEPWSRAGDIYSFGVIVGQMMGMFPPNQDYEVPSAISDVVWRALSENPRDRFADVDAFASALLITFERGERQTSAIGLRAVAPGPARHESPVRGSGGEAFATLTGALDVSQGARELPSQPTLQEQRRPPSVLLDPSVESLTPVTRPPFQLGSSGGNRQLPSLQPQQPQAGGGGAPRVRVPFPLILLLMFATASLALAILYNVVDMRFDAQVADKAPALQRLHGDRRTTAPVATVAPAATMPAQPAPAPPQPDSGVKVGTERGGGTGSAQALAQVAAAVPAVEPVAKPPPICGPGVKRSAGGPSSCISAYEYPSARVVPRVGVTLSQARALCAERGQRLCRKKEWEDACRGEQGLGFPYGAVAIRNQCNTVGRGRALAPTGSFRRCRTPTGIYDLVGNAGEWVEEGAIKGGDVRTAVAEARCGLTRTVPPTFHSPTVGFRCCADLR
ncbi:MAG TPA: protein kinase [Polyangia bacterium]|nr:protein kinase [Polyangia bacterium]